MDAIAYAHADKQQQRIKKVIAEPDSTSGLVTMPSTIAVGETTTIPAGRVVVHPNLQVDGTLDIQGDLFIPSGGTSDQLVSKSGDTMTGNLNFSGTGLRITGDFSNTTASNKTMFQSNTINGFTSVELLPNGTGTSSYVAVSNSSDVNNASIGYITSNQTVVQITSTSRGTGTLLPMSFSTGNAERLHIDTSGNVLVTGSGGLGYGIGSGGVVTQLTSKSTAVTLNKPCGQITMNNESFAAGTATSFKLNNSILTPYDTLIVTIKGGIAVLETYRVAVEEQGNSYAYISLYNISAGALSEAVVLNFAIIKGRIN